VDTEAIITLLEIAQHAQHWVNPPSGGGLIPPSGGADHEIPPFGGAGPSGNDYQTPEGSPRPSVSGAPSAQTTPGPAVSGAPSAQATPGPAVSAAPSQQVSPATQSWLRGQFRDVLREEGLSIPSSLASTPSTSLQATPVQPSPADVGPSTPGPKTPQLLTRAVKRLFEDTEK
jgi:hypothetical protein